MDFYSDYYKMGIKNLNSVIKESMKKTTFDKLRGSIIGVDFSLFLYRFVYNKNNPIECFLRQVHMFFRYKILPIYVIDGNAPLEKQVTFDKRAQKRQKMYDLISDLLDKQHENNSPTTSSRINSEITKLERRCVVFSQKQVQDILYFFISCAVVLEFIDSSSATDAKIREWYFSFSVSLSLSVLFSSC